MRDAGSQAVHVIGGGLAGSEAAWQLALRGHAVRLHEMRPARMTPAHQTEQLAELVCSNTFKSTELSNAHGLLKAEMRVLSSLIIDAAHHARVPGGSALTVDRRAFADHITTQLVAHPAIEIVREEMTEIPSPCIVATGPLTSDALARELQKRLGSDALAFYDAIAPIVAGDSIDTGVAFRASRYGKETMSGAGADGAYLNCPLSRAEYEAFIDALLEADQYQGREFDPIPYFEGCMPVEEMARRGRDTPRFGPMKPVGLRDPRTGRMPWAVVQLRMEDRLGQMWNLVGFQTRLRTGAQRGVFRTIPGLADAEFLRFGSVHRNAYVNAPRSLTAHLSLRDDPLVLLAGQLTGVEGYTESAATGLMAGINLSRMLQGEAPALPGAETMFGALYRYLREADATRFQPMNANFGLLEPLPNAPSDKRRKKELLAARALAEIERWRDEHAVVAVSA